MSEELRNGELVCIFPEGRITHSGEVMPFRPGLTRVLENDPVPVIPVALQGLWGSFFSRKGGAAMTRPLRRGAFSRIGVNVGGAITAADAAPDLLRARVAALRGNWL